MFYFGWHHVPVEATTIVRVMGSTEILRTGRPTPSKQQGKDDFPIHRHILRFLLPLLRRDSKYSK